MTQHPERICELAHASAEAEDADAALRALTELRQETDAFIRVHARRALCSGRSFSDIARAMGISRQAAHRRFRDLMPERRRDGTRPLTATDAARRVVRLARVEALAAGAPPGSEHVLLGVLRTDSETARALRYNGVTPERARAHARGFAPERAQTHTQNGAPNSLDDGSEGGTDRCASGALARIVKHAARVALSRGDPVLDVQSLLQAAVEDADGGARRMLNALAVSRGG
jgi:transposase-like protein